MPSELQFLNHLSPLLDGKVSAYNAGDPGSIPGSGRSPGEGNGNPLQFSCLETPMDAGASQATVHGVAKSWTRQSDFTFTDRSLLWILDSGVDASSFPPSVLLFQLVLFSQERFPLWANSVFSHQLWLPGQTDNKYFPIHQKCTFFQKVQAAFLPY